MNTQECFKKTIRSCHNLTRSTLKLLKCQKQLMLLKKTHNQKVLRKFVDLLFKLSFGRDITRRRHSPNLNREWFAKQIVTHRIWQRTIHHIYRHSPYFDQATKFKHPNFPFSLKHISNIYLFPDLTISVPTDLFRRRINRTIWETRLILWPEICSVPIETIHRQSWCFRRLKRDDN